MRQAGRGNDAVQALRKYTAADPQNLPLLAVLAAELARDPATQPQADELFAQLDSATNDPKVLRVVVRSHVERGRPVKVIADLDQAYQAIKGDDPKQAEARAFAAEKARAIAELLRAEPDWAAAVLRAASEDLRAGVRRAHQTWHILGVLAARHNKLDLAVDQFKQAVRNARKETEADAYAGLIDVLWRKRTPLEVARECRAGLQSAEYTAAVFFNFHLALALAELGEGDEAVAAADKAILQAAESDRLTVRLRKAVVLKVLGRNEDAIALCKKLIDEFDGAADQLRVRYVLAGAYWAARKFTEGEAELLAILDADPYHAAACNDLGYHLADQGRNLDEAERLVRHAIAVDRAGRRKSGDPEPENAAYLDSLAWVLFRKGKLPEARDLLVKVAEMPEGAGDAVVWDHLGDVYFRLGEKAKAKAAWDQAHGLYLTDPRGKRDGLLDEVKRKLKLVP
jgi:tetratricopeptide (TPR) repeat protein